MAALIIESGPIGRDPFADLDRRVSAAIEALPGVVAAAAWLGRSTQRRTIYIAVESGAGACAVRRATRRILRRNGVSVLPACLHIAPVGGPPAP